MLSKRIRPAPDPLFFCSGQSANQVASLMGCKMQVFCKPEMSIISIIDKPRKGENPSGALKTYGSGKDF